MTVASVALARCSGIEFETIHYNPQKFSSGEDFHITYYGQVSRTVDRDVNVHTTFYDKDRNVIHRGVSNWCELLEKYGGSCPMAVEDGFKVTFPFNFEADDAEEFITIEVKAVGTRGACYTYHEDKVLVEQDDDRLA
ncbi:hypothetical protein BGZ73_002968 [Actinomortierella ambigua]|nr:hypothetical protein BGZ73_002968 [Actinomortierella ambigua]